MLDERIDDVSEEERDVSFNAQSVYKRFAIVAAGPIANFVLAVAVLWLMFGIGVPTVKPVIGDVKPTLLQPKLSLKEAAKFSQLIMLKPMTGNRFSWGLCRQLATMKQYSH